MPAPLEVILYRKQGCGLCDQAEAVLARIAKRVRLRVVRVDIDEHPELQERYFLEIPVIMVEGEEVARAPISERPLEASLRYLAESR